MFPCHQDTYGNTTPGLHIVLFSKHPHSFLRFHQNWVCRILKFTRGSFPLKETFIQECEILREELTEHQLKIEGQYLSKHDMKEKLNLSEPPEGINFTLRYGVILNQKVHVCCEDKTSLNLFISSLLISSPLSPLLFPSPLLSRPLSSCPPSSPLLSLSSLLSPLPSSVLSPFPSSRLVSHLFSHLLSSPLLSSILSFSCPPVSLLLSPHLFSPLLRSSLPFSPLLIFFPFCSPSFSFLLIVQYQSGSFFPEFRLIICMFCQNHFL